MLAQTGWETNGIDNIDNTKIDHMKLDTNFSPFKIFGTTRSDNFESKGSQVNVFIVNLDDNHDVASVETFLKLEIGQKSYITGIDNSIVGDYIHLTYYDQATS